MKLLVTFILCLGFFITFHNTSDKEMHYWLWWESHLFNVNSPINLAGGELDVGEAHIIGREFPAGDYIAIWGSVSHQDDYRVRTKFTTTEEITIAITIPGEVFLE